MFSSLGQRRFHPSADCNLARGEWSCALAIVDTFSIASSSLANVAMVDQNTFFRLVGSGKPGRRQPSPSKFSSSSDSPPCVYSSVCSESCCESSNWSWRRVVVHLSVRRHCGSLAGSLRDSGCASAPAGESDIARVCLHSGTKSSCHVFYQIAVTLYVPLARGLHIATEYHRALRIANRLYKISTCTCRRWLQTRSATKQVRTGLVRLMHRSPRTRCKVVAAPN